MLTNAANSKTTQNILKAVSVACSLIAAAIGFIYFHADFKTVFILILFLVFFVLVPGHYTIKRFGLESEYTSSTLSRSFFAGFALNIVLYYLASITTLNVILLAVPLAMTALWLVRVQKETGFTGFINKALSAVNDAPASAWIFAFLVFLSSMFATQYSYIPPTHAAFSYIKQDFAYHAGIMNALAAGFPPLDPWAYGYTIYYHYYSEMLLSIPMRLFNLTSENLLLMGTPYLITPTLSISLYALFREFAGRKALSGLYCLAFHFSNMLILKNASDSWFLYHIYSNINNTGLGVSCMLTALVMLQKWDKSSGLTTNRFNTKEMIFFAALVMLMTGIKGPVALVLVGGMVGTALLGLIMRMLTRNQLALTLLSVISFVLIYVFVLAAQHDNASGGSVFNVGEVTDIFYLKDAIMEFGNAHGMPRIITWSVLFIIFMVFFLSAFLVPFIVGYIREFILTVTRKREFRFSRIAIYATWMAGFLGVLLLDFSGHSQVYFGFASCMLTPLISFWFLEDIDYKKNFTAKLIKAAFAVCMIIFSVSSFMYATTCAAEAIDYYQNRDSDKHEKYRSVSSSEYEALLWLKNNTPENALIASDRFNSVSMKKYQVRKRNNNTHFAYAIYSQRRQYLEGTGFSLELESDIDIREQMYEKLNRLYDLNNKERGKEARELGIDYIVVSKRFKKIDSLESKDYELCFSNEDMDIYKIREASQE